MFVEKQEVKHSGTIDTKPKTMDVFYKGDG
jgi:hypothetical protein